MFVPDSTSRSGIFSIPDPDSRIRIRNTAGSLESLQIPHSECWQLGETLWLDFCWCCGGGQYWGEVVGPEFEIMVAQMCKFKEGGGLGISLEGTVEKVDGAEQNPHHYIRSGYGC